MSVQTIKLIMTRVKGAPFTSPVAVFRKYDGDAGLDCVFANTLDTLRRVEQKDSLLIGVFSCMDHMGLIKTKLEHAERCVTKMIASLENSNEI